jgi:hypothetical protein
MKVDEKKEFMDKLGRLYAFQKKKLNLKETPKVFLTEDGQNAEKMLGKTAHYEPSTKTIRLNITNRHPKDILRSFAHEVIHHWQQETGQLDNPTGQDFGPQYAQKNEQLRKMEKQAYLLGNMQFRDWEDELKNSK